MVKPSKITNTARTYIEEKLKILTEQHNIRILVAIESGSRAWGFPSQNSDYDVRFIYTRSMDDYLSEVIGGISGYQKRQSGNMQRR